MNSPEGFAATLIDAVGTRDPERLEKATSMILEARIAHASKALVQLDTLEDLIRAMVDHEKLKRDTICAREKYRIGKHREAARIAGISKGRRGMTYSEPEIRAFIQGLLRQAGIEPWPPSIHALDPRQEKRARKVVRRAAATIKARFGFQSTESVTTFLRRYYYSKSASEFF